MSPMPGRFRRVRDCQASVAVLRLYSTTFQASENPISEGGNWVNGGTTGLDWADFRSSAGQAWGLQANKSYADGTAVIGGTWAANHYAQATVFLNSPPGPYSPELELRLRTSISAHSCTGYEVSFNVFGTFSVIRWNGPYGSQGVGWDFLTIGASSAALLTGDVIRAEIVGNTITVKLNGVTKGTTDITSIGGTVYSSGGGPGIGHNADGDGTQNNTYGFTAFSAGEL